MSTGLFSDEEGGYNLDETKFKLKLPTDSGESEQTDDLDGLEDLEDFGSETSDLDGGSDKPFNDEPFDAGVEADEETDPVKFIQQLSGKLGQSLRAYSDEQGQPDFDLEKFAVNSVLSATHTGQMDNDDQSDIIKKVKSSGNDGKEDIDVNVDVNTNGDSDNDVEVDTNGDSDNDMEVDESNFNLGEGKTPTNILVDIEKKRIFVNKDEIMIKLNEGVEVEPIVKPKVKPIVKPTRRQKPFRPKVQPNVEPKASNDVLAEGGGTHGKILNVKYLDNKIAILNVSLDGNEITMKFENTDEYLDKPLAHDEPWIYNYESVNSPDEKSYEVGVEFFGHPNTHLEVSKVSDDYIEEKHG